MPNINHRRPSTSRTCLQGRCCITCGFVCHRHWIASNHPRGVWREPTGVLDVAAFNGFIRAMGPTTPTPTVGRNARRNYSYDLVSRGTHPPAQPGEALITDEQIMEALTPPGEVREITQEESAYDDF